MNVGLCTISNKGAAAEDVIALAGTVGYDGVEVWGQDHIGDGSESTCRQLATAAVNAGLELPVYGSYLRAGTDEFAENLSHELAIADRLGVDLIRVWAGSAEYGDHDPAYFNRVVSDLRELTDRATELDIAVTVEKHAGTLTNTLAGAGELLAAVDHQHCGLNYQPGFSVPADVIAREVETLGPLVNHCHLQAVPVRGARERCPLSEAFFDVGGVLAGLADAGFDGYAMVEFVTDESPYRDAIADDLAYLRARR